MSTFTATQQAALLDGRAFHEHPSAPPDVVRMSPASINRAIYFAGALTMLLALFGLLGAFAAETQFAFSYLTAFLFAVSIAIGSLFWVMIHHLTAAGWSVVVRRLFENLTQCLPVLTLLFLPIALSLGSLYGWMDAEANANDPLWQAKRGYLNSGWFIARAAVYLLCWTGLAWRLRSWSVQQDQSGDQPPHPQPLSPGGARGEMGDPALTRKMAGLSSWGLVLLALTSTYAAFDWLMSLDYRWYTTMYGVYFWAGSIVSSLAALTLTVVVLRAAGWLRRTITAEHLHDLGKLLFAFTIFWAYIAFSQYLLIWYANLTEETSWYLYRLQGGWRSVTIALMLGHFVVPFVVLLRRDAKRSPLVLGFVAVWLLAFHYLDLYWQVMPTLHPEASLHWLDIVWLFAFVGVVMLGLLYGMKTSALLPARDPRLGESLRFHQE
jgi:hypothetical protein